MSSPRTAGHDRERGVTLWIVGWLSAIPCAAAPKDAAGWPLAAVVSLALVSAGLFLVRRAADAPAAEPRP